MSVEEFFRLEKEFRNDEIAFHGKANKACGGCSGFSGEIIYLDNGENTYPRFTAAKLPKLKKDLDFSELAKRFLRELELQVSAHYHPNVHWPFDVKMIHGVPVAYFRRWEGDLSSWIEDPSLGDVGRLSLIIQAISGLNHCLDRGLVFQDLKPENIFVRDLSLSFAGLPDLDVWLRPLIADFGSVNLAAEEGIFGGTRPYMAPEQWRKDPLGEHTAVFVMGVILHELMSRGIHPIGVHAGDWHKGRKPTFGRWQKNPYWRKWVAKGCPISVPLADTALAHLVSECLQDDPKKRPSLAELQRELMSILSKRSPLAADQVQIFLHVAEEQKSALDWKHLTSSISSLRRQIESVYPQA